MPTDIALKYSNSIDILQAQETLLQLSVLDYQKHMKQDDRRKFHKHIKKKATAHVEVETKSVDDLEAALKGLLSGR